MGEAHGLLPAGRTIDGDARCLVELRLVVRLGELRLGCYVVLARVRAGLSCGCGVRFGLLRLGSGLLGRLLFRLLFEAKPVLLLALLLCIFLFPRGLAGVTALSIRGALGAIAGTFCFRALTLFLCFFALL